MSVYSADTGVFFLLLSHSNQLNCSSLYIRLVKGFVDIKLLHSILGDGTSKALLSLHALTGSDTTGKFDGKSKQFWFRRFLTIDQNDSKLKEELVNFQTSKECTEAIESFVCRCYLYRSNKDSFRKLGEAVSLSDARYTLFTKRRLEGEKLPPTKDAFGFHLSRAFFQLSIWSSACDAIANNLDPLHHGWQLENDILTGIMAEQNIAPLEVVELVACKCKGKYKRSILNIPNNK